MCVQDVASSLFESTPALAMTNSTVPMDSPSHGGHLMVYVYDTNQLSLTTPFSSVLVFVSVFMVLSTVFHSVISPNNSPLSHSVLLALSQPDWSFELYVSLLTSPSVLI